MTVVTELIAKLGFQIDATGLDQFEQRLTNLGKTMGNVGQWMTTRLTLPILAAGGYIAKTAMDFEQAMNQVAARSGATGKEFETLRNQAKALGLETKYSATEVALGMTEFGKAGLSATQISQGMADTLSLAAAEQVNLADATSIAVATMGQFQLGADQVGRIADVLAKGAGSSIISLQDLAESLAYVGPTAHSAGISLEEASAAVATLGDLGVRGSRAGMSLGSAINMLRAPTDTAKKAMRGMGISSEDLFDTSGKLRISLSKLFSTFRGVPASQLRDIFGQEILRSMTGMFTQGDKVASTFKALGDSSGYAARQAAVMTKGAKGGFTQLRAAIQGLAIEIGDSGFLDLITRAVQSLVSFVRAASTASPTVFRVTLALAGLVAVIGPLLLGLSGIAAALMFLATPAGLVALAVVGAIAALAFLALIVEDFYAFMQGRPSVFGFILAHADEWLRLAKTWFGDKLTTIMADFFGITKSQAGEWSTNVVSAIEWVADVMWGLTTGPLKVLIGMFELLGNIIPPVWNAVKKVASVATMTAGRSNMSYADMDRSSLGLGYRAEDQMNPGGIWNEPSQYYGNSNRGGQQSINVTAPINVTVSAPAGTSAQEIAVLTAEQVQLSMGSTFRAVGRNLRSPYRN